MNIKIYSLAAITVVSFFSCAQKDKADEIDESLLSPMPVKPAQVASAKDSLVQKTVTLPQTNGINPVTGTINAGQQVNQQPTSSQAPAQVSTAGLNPAHGQPGHRCDIHVGAPLDSKPVAATAAPATVAVGNTQAPTITAVPVTTPTAPGMNPPHGQPNHRCDIAVGAPLNSKPVTAPAAAAPAPIMVTPVVVSDTAKKQ
jgi:hypothetical protein